jgi:hypothetical protein
MNETQIRARLRDAVGETSYPASLSTQVEDRLRSSAAGYRGGTGRRGLTTWPLDLRPVTALVAGVLVVLLMASLVFGVLAWREGGLFNRTTLPAGRSVNAYQTMLGLDSQRMVNSESDNCATLTDNCPAAAAAVVTALQKWLDDLNAAQPPARFMYIDLQMRRQITEVISHMNAGVAGYRAKNQNAMDTAINSAAAEADTLTTEVNEVLASRPASVAKYTANVRADNTILVTCDPCWRLVSQPPMSCATSQVADCPSDIVAARLVVETYQGDLVLQFAPDALAANDTRLQSHLYDADTALAAMDAARTSGNRASFEAARSALRQSLMAAVSDAVAKL